MPLDDDTFTDSSSFSKRDFDSAISEFMDRNEKIDLKKAMWFYNIFPDKRKEIYHYFFAKMNKIHEWLEVYKLSKGEGATLGLALSGMKKVKQEPKQWIDLYLAESKDEVLKDIVLHKIQEIGGNNFQIWQEIFDLAPSETQVNKLAMTKLKKLANTFENWSAIYSRAEFGSENQITSLENMYVKAREMREDEKLQKEKERQENIRNIKTIKPKEWLNVYNNENPLSLKKDEALINMYLAADWEANNKSD